MPPFPNDPSRPPADPAADSGEHRFHSLAEIAADAVITIDGHSRVLSWNRSAEAIFGYRADEMLGRSLHDVMPERYRARHDQGVARMCHGDALPFSGRPIELAGLRRDGSEFPLELTVSTWAGGGRRLFVGIIRDITERRRTEDELRRATQQAEEAVRAKSEFLAIMSHEVRTPLNGIIGMAQLLLDSPLDDVQRDEAETILFSGNALLAILNDILDFSKLEAGRMDLETIGFDPKRLVASVTTLMTARAAEKNLRLSASLAPTLPPALLGDPNRLRQILLNLVSNAIKFTDAGDVTITVASEAKGAEAAILTFTVRDTGIGISDEARSRLFASFSQADASISRRFGGTGLGLAICKKIVERMGGDIGVESEPGNGSAFWVTIDLPLAERTEDDARAQPALADHAASARPLSILLAEDNAINRKVAQALLERLGHRITTVEDGAAAVAAVQTGRFDAVLMDVQMPGMDGLEASRRIRALSGPAADVPIIALTANALAGDDLRCLAAGMTDYVSKPFSAASLSAALARVAGGAAAGTAYGGGSETALDLDILDNLEAALGRPKLVELLNDLIEDATRRVAVLTRAAAGHNCSLLLQNAHDLKSTSGNFGLRAVSQIAEAVELACRDRRNADEAMQLSLSVSTAMNTALSQLELRYPEIGALEAP